MKVRPLLCETINIRRFNIGMPVAAEISPTPIISKDKHDIRRSGSSLGGDKEGEEKGEEFDSFHDYF